MIGGIVTEQERPGNSIVGVAVALLLDLIVVILVVASIRRWT